MIAPSGGRSAEGGNELRGDRVNAIIGAVDVCLVDLESTSFSYQISCEAEIIKLAQNTRA